MCVCVCACVCVCLCVLHAGAIIDMEQDGSLTKALVTEPPDYLQYEDIFCVITWAQDYLLHMTGG